VARAAPPRPALPSRAPSPQTNSPRNTPTRRRAPDNEPKKAWQNFGFCFLGVVLASMLGLPLVLLHAKVIQNQDL
jgi:hypothetical protein